MKPNHIKNIRYGEGHKNMLDIYVASQPHTVVVFVHGGAWGLGDKAFAQHVGQQLSEEGISVVIPNYSLSCLSNRSRKQLLGLLGLLSLPLLAINRHRLWILLSLLISYLTLVVIAFLTIAPTTTVHHPAHVEDVAEAVRWTLSHLKDLNVENVKGVFLMGHSAGGHIASLLATNSFYLRQAGVSPQSVRGVISLSGVFSDKRLAQFPLGPRLLEGVFNNDTRVFYDAFPIYHVNPDCPPFMLINADDDPTLKRHTRDFHRLLRHNNVPVHTHVYEATHFNIRKNWDGHHAQILDDILMFISNYRNWSSQIDAKK